MPKYICWIDETYTHKLVVNAESEDAAENIIKEFVDSYEVVPEIEAYEFERQGYFGGDWVVDLEEETSET
jgi:hypothetical protein